MRISDWSSDVCSSDLAVLRAAVDLFNERGFHATSLDDIASRLGITKPAIYHYFGNKDQVLFHGLTVGMEQLRAAVDEARTHSGGGMDRLRAFLILYAEINMTAFGRRSEERRVGKEWVST